MNVKAMLVGFCSCLIICCVLFFTIIQRGYNKRLDNMSSEVSSSTSINEQLRATNTDLERRNIELTATVDGLSKQISEDNRRNQQTIAGLKSTITEISSGISSASGSVGEVIKKLGDIKVEVGSLK
jgi:predicted RNase H-like nuclease (RuvC/YqgF family)